VNEPGPRVDSEVSDDPSGGNIILFGGLSVAGGSYAALNDTWAFSTGTWTRVSSPASPPARFGEGLAFNSTAGPLDLFGGCATYLPTGWPTCTVPRNDLWTFSAGVWTAVTGLSGAPTGRTNFGFAASTALGETVAFGGLSASGLLNETWQLRNGDWTGLTNSLLWSPSARESVALTYDSASGTNYFVLFGGWNGTYLGETWVYPSPFSPLRVSAPAASPNDTDAGKVMRLNVTIAGGSGGYNRTWFGLPSGCSSANTSNLVCHLTPPPSGPAFYSVSIRVRDSKGSVVWSPSTAVEVNEPPQVQATATPTLGIIPFNVTLTAIPTAGTGTPPFSYNWTFGDGANATGNPVTHRYINIGVFIANVTMTDSQGVSYTAHLSPPVRAALPIAVWLSADPSSVMAGGATTFQATVTGGFPSYSYVWSGLPSTCVSSNTASLSCTANAAGTYTVTVQVTDAIRDNTSTSLSFVVTQPPGILTSSVLWAGVSAALAAAVLAVIWIYRRSRRPPRIVDEEPTGPPEPPSAP
jgi:hypothetical protein